MDFMDDKIFQLIPHGYDQRVLTKQLTSIGEFKTPRHLQRHIELLRNSGAVIASTCQDGGGYYIPQTALELRMYIQTCENRAESTLRSLEAAKQALKQMESE